MDNFDQDFDKIYADLKEQDKKPKPATMPVEQKLAIELDQLNYAYLGIITSGKLGSQQQIKLRKSFEKFGDDITKWTDPRVNVLLANKYHYELLKAKKLKDLQDE